MELIANQAIFEIRNLDYYFFHFTPLLSQPIARAFFFLSNEDVPLLDTRLRLGELAVEDSGTKSMTLDMGESISPILDWL